MNDAAFTSGISGSNSSINQLIDSDKTSYQHNQLINSIRDEVSSNDCRRVKQEETSLAKLPSIPDSSGGIKSSDVWFPPESSLKYLIFVFKLDMKCYKDNLLLLK